MSEKFCPSCGTAITNEEIYCPNCGFEIASNKPGAPTMPEKSLHQRDTSKPSDSTWKSLEDWVVLGGEFSWILFAISIIIRIISTVTNGILPSGTKGLGFVIWSSLSIAISVYLGVMFIKPFAEKCKAKDWYFLVNDVVTIGDYRIPKMLILGIALQIFSYWGGSLVLIVAILIIILGPEKVNWKVSNPIQ